MAFVAVLMSKFPVAIFLFPAFFSWPPFVAPKCRIVVAAAAASLLACVRPRRQFTIPLWFQYRNAKSRPT